MPQESTKPTTETTGRARIEITYNPQRDLWDGALFFESDDRPSYTYQDDDREAVLGVLIDSYAEMNGDEYPDKMTVTLEAR